MVFGFTESFLLVFGAESASVINVKPLLPAEEATTTTQESQTHCSASINCKPSKRLTCQCGDTANEIMLTDCAST